MEGTSACDITALQPRLHDRTFSGLDLVCLHRELWEIFSSVQCTERNFQACPRLATHLSARPTVTFTKFPSKHTAFRGKCDIYLCGDDIQFGLRLFVVFLLFYSGWCVWLAAAAAWGQRGRHEIHRGMCHPCAKLARTVRQPSS